MKQKNNIVSILRQLNQDLKPYTSSQILDRKILSILSKKYQNSWKVLDKNKNILMIEEVSDNSTKLDPKQWLHHEMTISECVEEMMKIDWVLLPALIELKKQHPELIADPNNFTSSYISRTKNKSFPIGKLRKKGFPEEFYSKFPKLTYKQSSSSIEGYQLTVSLYYRILQLVDDVSFEKLFGVHHISAGEAEEEVKKSYIPVLACYHRKSGLLVMFRIPDLVFLTTYALDEGQNYIFDQTGISVPRMRQFRTFDDILKLPKEDQESLLPSSYFNCLDHAAGLIRDLVVEYDFDNEEI